MKGHRGLAQSLEIFLLLRWRGTPNIFQYFVRFKELPLIEQSDAAAQVGRIHNSIVT